MKKLFAGITAGITAAALAGIMAMNVFAAQITEEEAKNIALNHAQVAADQVAHIFAKTDFDDGRIVYDVEFFTTDYKEYDYEISKEDGTILSFDFDAEHSYDWEGRRAWREGGAGSASPRRIRPEASITADQAKETALKQAGLTASQVSYIEAHEDYDDGRVLYEGKFFCGDLEYEIEVDATTGALIDCDVESIYD